MTTTFNELMIEVKATDSERLVLALKLGQMRAAETVKFLVDARKVTLDQLLQEFTI